MKTDINLMKEFSSLFQYLIQKFSGSFEWMRFNDT